MITLYCNIDKGSDHIQDEERVISPVTSKCTSFPKCMLTCNAEGMCAATGVECYGIPMYVGGRRIYCSQ
jgi:hypothetical protein